MKRSVLISVLFFLLAVYQFSIYQQGNFELKQVISDLENHSEWEFSYDPPPAIIRQTFTFLGAGDQAYAFLGEDKQTVLKLFKHYDKQGKRSLGPIFESCKLAYNELREETGLLYLHLNKTDPCYITLIDHLGFSHRIDINATEYALQKKADDLIFTTLERFIRKKNLEAARNSIKSLFSVISSRCSKGIGDRDTALRRNYGYLNDCSIALDIGSYFRDDSLKDPNNAQQEIAHKTKRLFRWLKKHCPDLIPFYQECCENHNFFD